MFEIVLPKKAAQCLAILGERKILDFAYLAGGTACALQLGHRISLDFDFFTQKKFEVDKVKEQLGTVGNFKLQQTDWGTIIGKMGQTKFSLFYYQYPLINSLKKFNKINIAALEDIAAMKLGATIARARARDYIDIYFLLQKFSLEEMLNFYQKKYKNLAANKIHILKSLQYFDDIVDDDLPEMLIPVSWLAVKKFLIQETKKFHF